MKPTWIVFDIGGVILDWHNCRQATVNKLNISLDEFNPVFQKYLPLMESGTITPENGFTSILSDLNLKGNGDDLYQFWQSNILPIKSTFKLIPTLKEHYHLAICTNTWIGTVEKFNIPEFPQIFSQFEIIVNSTIIKITKPKIDIYKKVESEIRAKGQEIFFIDDSLKNIEGAKQLNWQTFIFDFETDQGINSCRQLTETLL